MADREDSFLPHQILEVDGEYIRVDYSTGEIIEDLTEREDFSKVVYTKPLHESTHKDELLWYVKNRPKKKTSGGMVNWGTSRLVHVYDHLLGCHHRKEIPLPDMENLLGCRVMPLPHYKNLKVLSEHVMYRNLIIEDTNTVAGWFGTSKKNLLPKLNTLEEHKYIRVTTEGLSKDQIKIEVNPVFGWFYERNDDAYQKAVSSWYLPILIGDV